MGRLYHLSASLAIKKMFEIRKTQLTSAPPRSGTTYFPIVLSTRRLWDCLPKISKGADETMSCPLRRKRCPRSELELVPSTQQCALLNVSKAWLPGGVPLTGAERRNRAGKRPRKSSSMIDTRSAIFSLKRTKGLTPFLALIRNPMILISHLSDKNKGQRD